MAGAGVPTELGADFLQCTICYDTYKEPKILIPCLHTFCKTCLQEWVTKQEAGHFSCPVCRQEVSLPQTGVEGLKDNFFISSLVDAVQDHLKIRENPKTILCTNCETGVVATYRCVECAEFLCQSCESAHRLLKTTKGHRCLTINDLQTGQHDDKLRAKRTPKCEVHPGKTVRFYCTTCKVPICQDCTADNHKEPAHQHAELGQAATEKKKTIQGLINHCQGQVLTLHEHQRTLAKLGPYLEENEKKAKEAVTMNMKRLVTIVQQEEALMLDSITLSAAQQREEISNLLEEKQALLASAKRTCDFAMALAREGDNYEMLTFSNEMEQCLRSILGNPNKSPDAELANISVKYDSLNQQLKTGRPKNTKYYRSNKEVDEIWINFLHDIRLRNKAKEAEGLVPSDKPTTAEGLLAPPQ